MKRKTSEELNECFEVNRYFVHSFIYGQFLFRVRVLTSHPRSELNIALNDQHKVANTHLTQSNSCPSLSSHHLNLNLAVVSALTQRLSLHHSLNFTQTKTHPNSTPHVGPLTLPTACTASSLHSELYDPDRRTDRVALVS